MFIPEADKKYTYADYLTWPRDERWELIDGVPHLQSAPTWQHQSISSELHRQISNFLVNHPCRVFASPFDVRIPKNDEKDEEATFVVQPDLTVICDKNKLKGTGFSGVPLMVIEITSPSTGKMDKLYKFNKYEEAGVKEYWIVEPEMKLVSVFKLQSDGRYGRPDVYSEDDQIALSVLPELTVELTLVFKDF